MSKVKVLARDSFYDTRVGQVHAGQTVSVSKNAAEDLEKVNLVKIIGAAKEENEDDKDTLSSTEALKKEAKVPAKKPAVKKAIKSKDVDYA